MPPFIAARPFWDSYSRCPWKKTVSFRRDGFRNDRIGRELVWQAYFSGASDFCCSSSFCSTFIIYSFPAITVAY